MYPASDTDTTVAETTHHIIRESSPQYNTSLLDPDVTIKSTTMKKEEEALVPPENVERKRRGRRQRAAIPPSYQS